MHDKKKTPGIVVKCHSHCCIFRVSACTILKHAYQLKGIYGIAWVCMCVCLQCTRCSFSFGLMPNVLLLLLICVDEWTQMSATYFVHTFMYLSLTLSLYTCFFFCVVSRFFFLLLLFICCLFQLFRVVGRVWACVWCFYSYLYLLFSPFVCDIIDFHWCS